MSRHEYDILVIGGGSAGLTASAMAAGLGARIALVERGRPGGDCTWTGCVPSKALIRAARLAHEMKHAARHGLPRSDAPIDFASVMRTLRERRERIYMHADSPEVLAERNVDLIRGSASFVDPHTVRVESDSETRIVTSRYIIICAGATTFHSSIPGVATEDVLSTDTIFELSDLPGRILILGGGRTGVELGQALRRLGSEVTIVEKGEEILPHEEPECAAMVRNALEEEGIKILRNSRLDFVERDGSGYSAQIATGEEWQSVRCDKILLAFGRHPELEGLGLGNAGVEYDGNGISINHSCQTSADHIYACGDVTGGLNFSHVADNMARTAVTRILLKMPASYERDAVPWVTFSDPELAHLGRRADELEADGERFKTIRLPYEQIDRAMIEGDEHGTIIVHASAVVGRILGVHIVGTNAGEMINEFALAMKHGLTLRDISQTVHAYPTWTLGIRKAADQWFVGQSSSGLLKMFRSIFHLRGEKIADSR